MHTDKIIHTNRIYSREEIEAREYKLHVGRVLQDCKEIVKDVCDRNFDPIRQHIKEARFNRLVSGNISKNPMFTGVTREALQVMQNGDLARTGFSLKAAQELARELDAKILTDPHSISPVTGQDPEAVAEITLEAIEKLAESIKPVSVKLAASKKALKDSRIDFKIALNKFVGEYREEYGGSKEEALEVFNRALRQVARFGEEQ